MGMSDTPVLLNEGVEYIVIFYTTSGNFSLVEPQVKGSAAWPGTIDIPKQTDVVPRPDCRHCLTEHTAKHTAPRERGPCRARDRGPANQNSFVMPRGLPATPKRA